VRPISVYVGSSDGKMYAFDATNGTLRWSHQVGAAIHARALWYNDTVYFGALDGKLHALAGSDGHNTGRLSSFLQMLRRNMGSRSSPRR
jgi:eukaryotic-like serine/threonine-protein kinase